MQWKVTLETESGIKMYHYVDVADAPKSDALRRDLERIKQLKVVAMELTRCSGVV